MMMSLQECLTNRTTMASDVKFNIEPLKRLIRTMGRMNTTPIFKKWAFRYRSFVQHRFDRFSKGGGNWPSLSPLTIARRRKGKRKGKGRVAILRDTGTLLTALTPSFQRLPGQLQQIVTDGVRVGIGGPARHPGGAATIADIASFHQTGEGHLPVREIIVKPDTATINGMVSDVVNEAKRIVK